MTERFPPPPNLPAGNDLFSKVRFGLRRLLDLQVGSVLRFLIPWLETGSGRILEVGGGAQPYRRYIPANCRYQGLDWEGASDHFGYRSADTVYYSGGDFPFEENAFDRLFHTEVLEHVYAKEAFLKECCRVLKPGGEFFFTVPFQARWHYIPHDYWRFTPSALERLLKEAGFDEVKVKNRGTDVTVAAYKVISLVFRLLHGGLMSKTVGLLLSPLLLFAVLVGQVSLSCDVGSADDCLGYAVWVGKAGVSPPRLWDCAND